MHGNGTPHGTMKGETLDGPVELAAQILSERGICNAAILIRGDNQGVVGSYGRGHGRNLHVNLAVRRTEIIGTSSNVLYVLKYVESKLNTADPISRGELGPREAKYKLHTAPRRART
jgi:hypothetical protein